MSSQLVDTARDHLFVARMSQRYHDARQRFFGRISQAFKFVSAFSATAVFFTVQDLTASVVGVPAANIAAFSGVVFGVLQFIDFFANFESKANRHEALKKDYLALEADAMNVLIGGNVTVQDVTRLTEKRFHIETNEGPTLYWLSCQAFNEQVLMQTEPGEKSEKLIEIPWLNRILLNVWGGNAAS